LRLAALSVAVSLMPLTSEVPLRSKRQQAWLDAVCPPLVCVWTGGTKEVEKATPEIYSEHGFGSACAL